MISDDLLRFQGPLGVKIGNPVGKNHKKSFFGIGDHGSAAFFHALLQSGLGSGQNPVKYMKKLVLPLKSEFYGLSEQF